jgi:transcriptional regulator with XRE-family HTH domain
VEHEKIIKKIGLEVRKKRQQKEMSIEVLALNCGVAYSTVSNLERGVSKDLKASNLLNIIAALDIDLSTVFKSKLRDKINKIETDLKDVLKIIESI